MSDEQKQERVTLSAADGAALDAVLAQRAAPGIHLAGNGSSAGGVEDAERRGRVQGWLNVVGAAAAPVAPGDLVERTLAAVERERMKVRPGEGAHTNIANH
jgi:hypothetical protein